MDLFIKLQDSINKYADHNAFFINGVFYSYHDLAVVISKIRKSIQINTNDSEKIIGLVANDDIETYSAIIALWFEGRAYVPLNSEYPIGRNENIISQTNIITVLDSSEKLFLNNLQIIETKKLPKTAIDLIPKKTHKSNLAYLLFTSGSTGMPKGVTINRDNLTGIITALEAMKLDVNENDRCLQMSELTFDVSITSFLYPLLRGACVYTIPKGVVKFSYVYELLEDKKLTVAQLVPSLLNYLRRYFDEIYLPDLKYSLLTAEALPIDLAVEWSRCVPNAKIINLYGPTENTVWSSYYEFSRNQYNKSYNGILSIGKAMRGTKIIIIDENNQVLPFGEKGELCLSGIQLTPNYWGNDKKNKMPFFYLDCKNKSSRFYKTGDLCSLDEEGDIFFMGRIDLQAKIQGFRVELSEVEYHAKMFLKKKNVVAIVTTNITGNTEIGLAIEASEFNNKNLLEYLKKKMPNYMIPSKLIFLDRFPLNSSAKIDRRVLKNIMKS